MPGLLEAFEVYNRKKHSSNPEMFGQNHSNIGGGNTSYMFAREYRAPKDKNLKKMLETSTGSSDESSEPSSRKSSISSSDEAKEAMLKEAMLKQGLAGTTPGMVDVSHMSQAEFERVFNSLRKGEPNNRVNF